MVSHRKSETSTVFAQISGLATIFWADGASLVLTVHVYILSNLAKLWARPGFEPGTSRTLSENHTPRPTSQT